MNSLTPLQQKQLSHLPILESMVYVNLAINWAIALGIKDKKVYKHLKKHYHYRNVQENPKCNYLVAGSGWWIYRKVLCEDFIGMQTFYCTDIHEMRITYWAIDRGEVYVKKFELMRHLTMPDAVYGTRGEVYRVDPHLGIAVTKLGTYWFGKE